MHPVLARYLDERPWSQGRTRRMVAGLHILQELARTGVRPVTYKEFAEQLQPGLAPLAAGRVLADIGEFCTDAGWPNVTCFVVSAATGECSPGCRQIGDEGPVVARERARLAYGVHGGGPLVDPATVDATGR
ncbi:hypothetical protein [Blastococcus saxobsidens]|uniref:Uncharacterized protein n=1 Tax=Blastococcus saxobsidens (strain DD2) TaxID=1146883 RepID=H6RT31_BLASD|nr:hypothetical protein [Blastococcus saxobsidens]CCG04334.1 protein of unknown function [Blastococcus saxobsidens DD2]